MTETLNQKGGRMRRTLLLALLAGMAVLGTAVARDGGVNMPIDIHSLKFDESCKVDVPLYVKRNLGAIPWRNYSEYEAVLTFDAFLNSQLPEELVPRALALPDTLHIGPRVGANPQMRVRNFKYPGVYKYTVELVGCDTEDPFVDVG